MAANVRDLRVDEMEVVEEPFGGGRDESARAQIVGERPIGAGEDAGVLLEARKEASRTAGRRDREPVATFSVTAFRGVSRSCGA